ncbi:MAG: ribbon-helix-helix domain-containing protein [Nanoarchaeota archaeon]|nr:ribbon-helix-helix domain-containing protein [Nanoarchaeota archaeon]
MTKKVVYTRLDDDTIKRIDKLIEMKKFDSYSSFIRRATNEYLDSFEQKILA